MKSFAEILREGEALRLERGAEAARQLDQAFAARRVAAELTRGSRMAADWDSALAEFAPDDRKQKEDGAAEPDEPVVNRRQQQMPAPPYRGPGRKKRSSSGLSDLYGADDWGGVLSDFALAGRGENGGRADDARQPVETVEVSWDHALSEAAGAPNVPAARRESGALGPLWRLMFGAD
jgi:hypothetical protein